MKSPEIYRNQDINIKNVKTILSKVWTYLRIEQSLILYTSDHSK